MIFRPEAPAVRDILARPGQIAQLQLRLAVKDVRAQMLDRHLSHVIGEDVRRPGNQSLPDRCREIFVANLSQTEIASDNPLFATVIWLMVIWGL